MEFRIADTFTAALAKLTAQEQKAAKTTAFDLQIDPFAPGMQFHRIEQSKDANFWSIRVNRDLRIVIHKTAASFLLAYVDHHDKAYAWAERRRIEAHPRTGAIQIVEVRERIEEIAPRLPFDEPLAAPLAEATPAPLIFVTLSHDDLMAVGVPEDWVDDIRDATEDRFLNITAHIPPEAAEALLQYFATGTLPKPEPAPVEPFAHPDTLRRIRVVENAEALQRALDAPWETWAVFLHPSQRAVIERTFSGPARVAGSAGTGKTVVALHRAARLLRDNPEARLLLATFSHPLARALERKLKLLVGEDKGLVPRARVTTFRGAAEELFQLAFGYKAHPASEARTGSALTEAAKALGITGFTSRFLLSEWGNVVDPWQIDSAEAYANVPRLGRKNRLGAKQRERLWPVFAETRKGIAKSGLHTWPQIFSEVATFHAAREHKPFTHIVVDEAQDLGVGDLRFLAAIAPPGPDALFFAGDLGQRIFQQPFSWKALGVDVRGRSHTLKVNYRTSHQIRQAADRLMPKSVRDVDGLEEDRSGTVSVFNGPPPVVVRPADDASEIGEVAAFITAALGDGIAASEIGIFVRDDAQLPRARGAVSAAGQKIFELSEEGKEAVDQVSIGTMHLAKGLEFKAVAVMACDEEVLPLQPRVEAAADEVELDDIQETERQLLYVACTRARDRLMVSGAAPGSEFLDDFAR